MQRTPILQTRRDAWVEIDLGSVEHNIKTLKSKLKEGTKIMAVVKADAYGHGAAMSAPTLVASGVDMLGVASVDEGLELRNAGIKTPILVLGAAPDWAIPCAVENDIQLSIFTDEHIEACVHAYHRLGKKPEVHIKIDTGMHRIGVSVQDAVGFIRRVSDTNEIKLEGVFSHLCCADNAEISHNQNQLFQNVMNQLENRQDLLIHLVNTDGMLNYQDLHYDMARVGIGIYGLVPGLKQVISLKGRITHLKELPKGSGISYEYSYVADKPIKIVTIPIGYADGVARSLSNKIYGIAKGIKIKQVGNITMDQMMFDVSDVPNIKTGDIITLLGKDGEEFLPVSEWAEKLGTINYEIACRLKVRLPRVYTRSR